MNTDGTDDAARLREIEEQYRLAHDELMRVTGMGKFAKNVRGGPPNPPRASIPARPEYDTDLVIGRGLSNALFAAREALALRDENARLRKVEIAAREYRKVSITRDGFPPPPAAGVEWVYLRTGEALDAALAALSPPAADAENPNREETR